MYADPLARRLSRLHVGFSHTGPGAPAPAFVAGILLEVGQTDVAVSVVVGARLLLLKGMVIAWR